METLTVAKELYDQYEGRFHSAMSETKMHKLMYFTQREALMYDNVPLFEEAFLGWKYGPVLKSVRTKYHTDAVPFSSESGQVSEHARELISAVLDRYGSMSAWKLSELTHEELSWKRSRQGLSFGENGDRELELSAMRVDAAREHSLREEEKS